MTDKIFRVTSPPSETSDPPKVEVLEPPLLPKIIRKIQETTVHRKRCHNQGRF